MTSIKDISECYIGTFILEIPVRLLVNYESKCARFNQCNELVTLMLRYFRFLTCRDELSERPIRAPVCRSVGWLVCLSVTPNEICKVLLIYWTE